jgi:hypothetical protein
MKPMLAGLLLATAALVPAAPAAAGELQTILDLSFRVRDGGFTLGGRVDGPDGPSSGAVSGRLKPGGVVLDGWLDDRGQTTMFEIDASMRDGAMRAVIRRSPQRI